MKLKKVSNNEQIKNYKININLNSYFKNKFCVGDTIQNKEDNSIGVIDKIKNGTIYVKYKDNTIERINELNAKDYIDFADVEVEPIIQEPTQPKQHTTVNKRNLQDIQFTQDAPIDKLAEKEYNKLKETKQQLNKEQEVENLIRLAIAKNMIDKDDYDFEKLKALSMDEQDFEDYKDEINNFSSQSVVSSSNDDEDANLTEAERMLKQIKTGKIQTAGNVDFDKVQSDTRDLSTVASKPIQRSDNLPPIISPTPSSQGYNKYDWMNEIEWTMGSRN